MPDAEDNPLLDFGDSVFSHRDALAESYEPERILERDEEIDQYAAALRPVVEGDTPDNIMVYGNTGAGKTAVTRYMIDMMYDACDTTDTPLSTVQLNCNEMTAFKVVRTLVNDLRDSSADEFPARGLSTRDALDALYEEIDKRDGTVLLILDEIDHIEHIDSLLYDLSRSQATGRLEHANVGIIGISNDYTFRDTLSAKTKGSFAEEEIDFTPYNADELEVILSDRAAIAFNDDAITDAAIKLCAALAAQDSGNARQGLDILKAAGKTADDYGDDVVTEDHIRDAQKTVERGNLEQRISSLTVQQRHILHTLALLEIDNKTPARTKEIYSLYTDVCEQSGLDPLSTTRSVRDHLDKLSMQGFADQILRNEGRSGGKYHVYECSMRADIVLEAAPRD
ncbi:orc1/cdc6 family replication initiation protein [Natronolimnohabitans sp. A-GB9]|uniref:Cdc6/Cdc18 family protein n=1 Tax=Natronolimnohabitans sp. A-GB9 TaxID=3069757 RepID=UPI0027AE57AF|nr:orc1/cdc6 family replication initiation protein [Natronolimnohabitans sp. A-GB9]MDQ2052588.1 orc1/cdc6 family replication initiation protein [Natronolimnohabitans sp. A-GB9]